MKQLIILPIFLLLPTINCIRKIRHQRGAEFTRQDLSRLTPAQSTWSLGCPEVPKREPYDTLEVTWSLGGLIWLRIDQGTPIITNKLSSYNTRDIYGKSIVKVALNNFRYKFLYDEYNDQYSMTIEGVVGKDQGVWECHVKLSKFGGRVEQFSDFKKLMVAGAMRSRPVDFYSGQRRTDEPVTFERISYRREKNRRRKIRNIASFLLPNKTLYTGLILIVFSIIFRPFGY